MPTPTTWSSVGSITVSGSLNIDALLGNLRWAGSTVTYSFPGFGATWSSSALSGYGTSSGGREPWSSSFAPLSSPGAGDDQTYFALALQKWSNVANLQFSQVAETSTSVGDIRAAYTYQSSESADTVAWTYYPGNSAAAGDMWFNTRNISASEHWTPGSDAFFAVLHELGHALGLKHPFEGTKVLNAALDSQAYTIMSYSAQPGVAFTGFSYSPTTPMVLDVAAIQYVYGANAGYHAGNDSYVYSDASAYNETIWDGGGSDTLQYDGVRDASIDLRAGIDYGSRIGLPVYVQSTSNANLYAVNNVWIANGAVIESALGGSGNDRLTGNDANNSLGGGGGSDTLVGGTGDDILDGGAGSDSAVYSGKRAAYTVSVSADNDLVRDTAGSEGSDTLSNVERLSFGDGTLRFDVSPDQLAVARIYQAVMGRAPDSGGLDYWAAQRGSGVSTAQMAQGFMGAPEFAALYGSPGNSAFVELLYHNALGRAADPAGSAYWVGALGAGTARAEVIAGFADSAELVGIVSARDAGGVFVL